MERSDVGFASEGRSFPIILFHGRREPSPICGGVCQPLELANISMSPPLEILRWLCSRLTPPVSISLSRHYAYLTESMDRPGRSPNHREAQGEAILRLAEMSNHECNDSSPFLERHRYLYVVSRRGSNHANRFLFMLLTRFR